MSYLYVVEIVKRGNPKEVALRLRPQPYKMAKKLEQGVLETLNRKEYRTRVMNYIPSIMEVA